MNKKKYSTPQMTILDMQYTPSLLCNSCKDPTNKSNIRDAQIIFGFDYNPDDFNNKA